MQDHKLILLTGPGGSGKSTIAQLLVDNLGYVLVDGDRLDTEFFPKGDQWDAGNISNLRKAHDKILKTAKDIFENGKNVVIDYIIFGEYAEFISSAKAMFGNSLDIKVLFPSEEETVKRDSERKTWTTGTEKIKRVRAELENVRGQIGSENFIDTSGLSPEETYKKYFNQ